MMFSKGENLLFVMNYSSRLVIKSNMEAHNEFIMVVNANGKAAVWQHFGHIQRPGNFKLDENTAVYLSSSAATSGGTMNLRNFLGLYRPTTLSKAQMKNRPQHHQQQQHLSFCVEICEDS